MHRSFLGLTIARILRIFERPVPRPPLLADPWFWAAVTGVAFFASMGVMLALHRTLGEGAVYRTNALVVGGRLLVAILFAFVVWTLGRAKFNAYHMSLSNRELTWEIQERQRIQAVLRESEENYRLLFDRNPHPMFVYEIGTHRLLAANAMALVIYGYSREELLGMKMSDLWPEEDRPLAAEREAKLREQAGQPSQGHARRYVKKDGSVRNIEIASHELVFEGRPARIVLAVDVTERLKAECELAESSARFRDFTESASDWFWEMDADLRFVSIHGPNFETRVRPLSKVIGKLAWDVPMAPGTEPIWMEYKRTLLRHEPFRDFILHPMTDTGERRVLRVSGIPRHDAQGQFLGMRGTTTDITQARQAERQAAMAERRLRDAIESLPAGFLLFDSNERLVLRNSNSLAMFPAIFAALGPSPTFDEMMRARLTLAPEADGKPEPWIRERLVQARKTPASAVARLRDGRWIRFLSFRTSEEGWLVLMLDVTEERNRELALVQAQKMEAVGQLTGGVAHDFNNLLQVIAGYTELAIRSAGKASSERPHLMRVQEATQKAANLTQQLLAFGRKREFRPQPSEAGAILEGMAKLMDRVIPEHIELSVKPPGIPLPIQADRGMIEQVILNLAINARDAMPGGGRLTLEADSELLDEDFCHRHPGAAPGRYAVIHCRDMGVGIAPEILPRLFEPFFTTKDPGKGTGLGLAMVYTIVQQHHGFVLVNSELGKGSVFSVYLPLAESRAEAAPTVEVESPQGRGETILMAEDMDAVRELNAAILTNAGYRVLAARDGKEALDLFDSRRDAIDALLLDAMMPNMSGWEAYRRIQSIKPGVKALFSSGWSADEQQHLREIPGLVVLQKPHSPDELLRAVHRLLRG